MVLAALALVVAGCGGNDEKQATSSAATATATQSADADADADQDADKDQGEDADKDDDADKDEDEEAGGADKPCSDVGDIDGEPKTRAPGGRPVPRRRARLQSEGPFGKTMRYFAVVDGGPDDLPPSATTRRTLLVENGYKLLSKDQEEGAEAEAHLSGKHTSTSR